MPRSRMLLRNNQKTSCRDRRKAVSAFLSFPILFPRLSSARRKKYLKNPSFLQKRCSSGEKLAHGLRRTLRLFYPAAAKRSFRKKGGGKETRQSPRRACKNNTAEHKRKTVTACAKQFRSVSAPKCFRVSRGFSPFPRRRAARKNCFSGGFFAPQKKSNFF